MMKGLKEGARLVKNEDSSDQSGENSGEQSGDEKWPGIREQSLW